MDLKGFMVSKTIVLGWKKSILNIFQTQFDTFTNLGQIWLSTSVELKF